ncbi:MAG: Holliday junction resolvase RuvX [Alphaproteobacteria bacterium]|nr:Holliday junction resolvase RuvX [Alphaproteobacteria bacterium]
MEAISCGGTGALLPTEANCCKARTATLVIVKTPAELAEALKPGERLFGLDLGEKTIGIALTDVLRTVATPLETLARGKFSVDAQKLIDLIKKHNVGGLVIGLPLNMNGTEGPSAQSARAFARNFEGKHPLPILFWDERLSTTAVTRTLIEADVSRAKRKEVVDKMAASFILQGVLEAMRRG